MSMQDKIRFNFCSPVHHAWESLTRSVVPHADQQEEPPAQQPAMIARPPEGEDVRLEVLRTYHILDTDPEDVYDDITRLAAFICGTPIATITFIDAHRQWFKSVQGLTVTETPRDLSFCAHTLLQPDMLIVPDATLDPRFADNPLVTGDPFIRFYAGVPLVAEEGHALGALCVIDRIPKSLNSEQELALRTLARQVTNQLETTRRVAQRLEREHHAAAQDLLLAERERSQETVRRNETRFRQMADTVPGILWTAQADGSLDYCSRRWYDYTGLSEEQTLGGGWQAALHPEFIERVAKKFKRHIRKGWEWEDTFPLRGTDGDYRWFLARAFPFRDDAGKVAFWCGTNIDVTEQRVAEEKLATAYHREVMLNQIGQLIRETYNPDTIQERAVALLGAAISTDRCFYVTYDLAHDRMRVSQDWHRDDLPSLAGDYRPSDFSLLRRELFSMQETAVVTDVQAAFSPAVASLFEQFRHRAVLAVPFYNDGELVAALYVSEADAPRAWTMEEVTLAEQVATLTRTAFETARVTQKERAIAQQLQQALKPAIPPHVPGLELAQYYCPALDEAGVGGDFSDVFAGPAGVTFLVVGDLSGKGLAAAAQVATVRNMLRYAVFRGRTLSGALTNLNAVLVGQSLLSGFATLFVGRYDAAVRQLAYVNCGQDAGLVLRQGTGHVDALPPSGPVLGGFEGAEFLEASVTLERGDVLALFTDGLTEAGPSRRAMLGGEGVAALLQRQIGQAEAQGVVTGIMAAVDAFAQGGIPDDQCLLVGIVA